MFSECICITNSPKKCFNEHGICMTNFHFCVCNTDGPHNCLMPEGKNYKHTCVCKLIENKYECKAYTHLY